jgi:hypothetical protein
MLREGELTGSHRSPASQPSPLDEQNRAVMLREGELTGAHRSPASQPSPLDEKNRAVMLREGERGAGFGQGSARERWIAILELLLKW